MTEALLYIDGWPWSEALLYIDGRPLHGLHSSTYYVVTACLLPHFNLGMT